MEARARRGQKKSPEEANQVIQVPSQVCITQVLMLIVYEETESSIIFGRVFIL